MAKKVWVVAAGTGGHIFPGLTLVEEIKKINPEFDFLFFGTADRLESKIIPSKGFPLKILKSGQFKGNALLSKIVVSPLLMAIGFMQVLLEYFKARPKFLIGVGGYVSVPVGLVAALFRVPIFLLEPNIKSGAANCLLSRFAKLAFTTPGSDAMTKLKCKTLDYGNPIRGAIIARQVREKVKTILVLGGSQGALSVCRASLMAFSSLKLEEKGIEMIVQSGEKNFEQTIEWQKELTLDPYVKVVPFIQNMAEYLEIADVVVARAGAMTVAEITESHLPTIFVPYPYAADDHQTLNAKLLEDSGAAMMVSEKAENFQAELESRLQLLVSDSEGLKKRKSLADKLGAWARPKAALKIAKTILENL
jgi:UDP-N-acetylglucosamine--N-acetylmuramyl-(pentapeptide) pyrophosphoryl-undecaprenol N-acetylglucosamine transferase